MTQFFTQKQIDALRECFNVYSDEGRVRNASQLRYMMRCLSYPVTQQQSVVYFEARKKNFDFAAFLETVHEESAGNPTTEVIRALRGLDREGNRAIPATELRALLMGVGERMSRAEVDAIMKEIAVGTIVPHQKLIQLFASNPNSQ